MDLKKTLKTIKLHENQISMVFGVIILLIAGFLVIHYIKSLSSPITQTPAVEVQNQSQTHKVTKGETLWSIAVTYYKDGFSWKKIADANKISDPAKLEVGQELTIPALDNQTQVTMTPAPTVKPKPQITDEAASTTSEIGGANYKVVKGDNLWKIALRAYGDGFQWTKIARANNLKNPNLIHPGNVFVLPR